MSHPPLYTASVPVLLHYLAQAEALVARTEGQEDALRARLAPDMFTAAQQFATASGFALRIACSLAGQETPEFAQAAMDRAGVLQRIRFASQRLQALDPADFALAQTRKIHHRAGFAELEQTGEEFLHRFGMPNFVFHLSMGFALLRREGLDIGKGDFDGQHEYPPGFRF